MEGKEKSPFNESSPKDKSAPAFDDMGLNTVWNVSESARPGKTMAVDEIENALEKVNRRIDDEPKPKHIWPLPEQFWIQSRYLAAAMALIIFGAYFLFTPKSITVPYGEMAAIELPDGSEAELNSGTTLSYSRFYGRTNRELTLNGEAYFSVKPGTLPFKVKANGTVTEVTGTRFNIRSWSDDPYSETTVTVTEGEVNFYAGESSVHKISLAPGNLSRWNTLMDAPSVPGPVTVSDITGWRENRLIFKEQPLSIILNELERRFNTRIDLEIPGAEQETLTAYYTEPGNVQTVLEDISLVKGFRYAATANGYRIFK